MTDLQHPVTASVLRILVAGVLALVCAGAVCGQARAFRDEGPQFPVQPPVYTAVLTGGCVGDVDGDGMPDLVVGRTVIAQGLASLAVLFNDGAGGFAPWSASRTLSTNQFELTRSLELADLDGDGDLDLVHCIPNRGLVFWENDGRGGFSRKAATLPAFVGTAWALSIAVGDLDGDGDADLVLCVDPLSDQVLVNDGKWSFSAGFRFQRSYQTLADAIAIGDADGDGVADVLFLHRSANSPLWFGIRSGGYRQGPFLPTSRSVAHCALKDLDGDGLAEALVEDTNPTTGKAVALIYKADGKGGYGLAAALQDSLGPYLVWDFDGDGHRDLFSTRFWRHTGKLQFTDVTSTALEITGTLRTYSRFAGLADVDGDQDLDVVALCEQKSGSSAPAYYWQSPLILRNLRRHVQAPDSVKLGTKFEVELIADHGHVMILALSAAEASIPLGDLGVLRVDPGAGVVLPGQYLTGRIPGTWSAQVPMDARLVGITVHSQALDHAVVMPGPSRLTGLRRTKIVQ